SSRAVVFDHSGQVVSIAQKEFEQHYPRPGWVEHDPLDIWSSQHSVTTEAISRADLTPKDIVAAGLTNQRETTLLWDRETGQPVYNAIVWQDRRTADFCKTLIDQRVEPIFRQKTGLRLDPYFAGTKIAWILDQVEGVRQKAEQGKLLFGTVDTWLLWKFTDGKVHVTDVTNASRTLLYNIHTGEWDDELLEILNVPRSILPEVRSSSEVYGHIGEMRFSGGIPLAGIAGDQHAALFGQCCFQPGMAKNTYGTGCFLVMNTGKEAIPSQNNLLTTVAWKIGDVTEYALEGSVFIGGAVVQWLRDELRLIETAAECDTLAETVHDTADTYLVPAFAGLGAPHWDPYARGAILGLTRGANRAHLCRAALESIAFQVADLIDCMEKDSGITLTELRADGGAARSRPMLQFQADLLQSRVIRPRCMETTSLGAAYLAGLAVGYWDSKEEIARNWSVDAEFTPEKSAAAMQSTKVHWQRALERAKAWAVE
ncbi:MAG: glycerol kinase GlpK, partial [Planctomycetia bacterium]